MPLTSTWAPDYHQSNGINSLTMLRKSGICLPLMQKPSSCSPDLLSNHLVLEESHPFDHNHHLVQQVHHPLGNTISTNMTLTPWFPVFTSFVGGAKLITVISMPSQMVLAVPLHLLKPSRMNNPSLHISPKGSPYHLEMSSAYFPKLQMEKRRQLNLRN